MDILKELKKLVGNDKKILKQVQNDKDVHDTKQVCHPEFISGFGINQSTPHPNPLPWRGDRILKQVQDDIIKQAAFTLAEVLITIGIIGVVAAMTIPTLNTKIKQNTASVQLRKMYSTLRNAARMYQADNGIDIENFDTTLSTQEFLDTYFKPYLKGATFCESVADCWDGKTPKAINGQNITGVECGYKLADGTILGVHTHAVWDGLTFFFDVDGSKGDNQSGHDIFNFYLYNRNTLTQSEHQAELLKDVKSDIYPGGNGASGSPMILFTLEEIFKTDSVYNGIPLDRPCVKGAGISPQTLGDACAVALFKNNWKFPKDYPW